MTSYFQGYLRHKYKRSRALEHERGEVGGKKANSQLETLEVKCCVKDCFWGLYSDYNYFLQRRKIFPNNLVEKIINLINLATQLLKLMPNKHLMIYSKLISFVLLSYEYGIDFSGWMVSLYLIHLSKYSQVIYCLRLIPYRSQRSSGLD